MRKQIGTERLTKKSIEQYKKRTKYAAKKEKKKKSSQEAMWIFARSHDKGACVSVLILGGWSFGRASVLFRTGF
jgi:hypothetical protein